MVQVIGAAARNLAVAPPRVAQEPQPPQPAVEAAADAPVANRVGVTSSPPIDRPQAMALSVVLAGMMDPLAVIAGMSAHLRDLGTETSADAADGARAEGEREDASRLECLRRAEKALKKAQSRMPKWAKKLISGILAAVGTIASCVTGGASLALVVVACVLMAAADVVDFLTEKGLIDAKVGMAISLTCKLAAAVCTFGAGFVNAGAAAAQVPQAVQTFKTISDLVSTATTIITAGFDVGRGVREFQGNMQQIKAEVHEGRRDDAHERMEECVSVMRASHERFVRVARSIQGALQAQGEVRAAAVMQPA